MKSKVNNLKHKAIKLRKQGISIIEIERSLGVAKSTLSYWFRDIELNKRAEKRLAHAKTVALFDARRKASLWHNEQKALRIEKARLDTEITLSKINLDDPAILELCLAILYLGEGFKKSDKTGLGNSDPLIVKFFVESMKRLYDVGHTKQKFHLHLRADQNPEQMKKFWSNFLDVSLERFGAVSLDQQTLNKPTYDDYKGVCIANYGSVAIQRKLVYLGRIFCEKIIENLKQTRG